jgi:hypothetical protein
VELHSLSAIKALQGPILITGHTGFKGAWLSLLLHKIGVEIAGISLPAEKNSLCTRFEKSIVNREYFLDIRNREKLKETIQEILDNRLKNFRYDNKRDRYAEEVNMWEKVVSVLSKNKKFDVYFWNSEEERLIYCESNEFKNKLNYLCKDSKEPLIRYLRKNNCTTMEDETNGLICDSHFGITGHIKQSEIFYNEITNNII